MATATYSFRLTAEGFQAFAKDLEAVGNSSEEARRAVQQLVFASPQLAGALDKAQVAADKARTSLQQVAVQGGTAARTFGRNTSQAFTQVGFQVGDFITQLQSGGNAFVAFAQQGSQLAGSLAGGMAGLAVSIAAMGAQYLFSGDATKQHTSATEGLSEALTELDKVTTSASDRALRMAQAQRQNSLAALEASRAFNQETLSLLELDAAYARSAAAGAARARDGGRRGTLRPGIAAEGADDWVRISEGIEAQMEVMRRRVEDRMEQIRRLGAAPLDTPRTGGGTAGRTDEESEERFADLVRRGMRDAEQQAGRVRDAYERVAGALEPATAAQQRYNDQVRALDQALEAGMISQERYTELVSAAGEQLANRADTFERAFDTFFAKSASAFEQAVISGGSLREVFQGLEKDIATLIFRLTVMEPLLSAIKGAYRGAGGLDGIFGGLFGSLFGGSSGGVGLFAPLLHSGGEVGAGGTAGRQVPSLAFAAAPRFHMGVDEVPAILKKGERVLTKEQARAQDQASITNHSITVQVRDTNATPARIAAAVKFAIQRSKEEVAMEADRGGRYAQRVGRRN